MTKSLLAVHAFNILHSILFCAEAQAKASQFFRKLDGELINLKGGTRFTSLLLRITSSELAFTSLQNYVYTPLLIQGIPAKLRLWINIPPTPVPRIYLHNFLTLTLSLTLSHTLSRAHSLAHTLSRTLSRAHSLPTATMAPRATDTELAMVRSKAFQEFLAFQAY